MQRPANTTTQVRKRDNRRFPEVVRAGFATRQPPPPQGEPCDHCGAPVGRDDRFCPSCGAPRPPAPSGVVEAGPPRHFRCRNCGSQVTTDQQQRSYTCPFCDSNYVVEFSPEESGRHAPEFVIGFTVTPSEAREKFRRWIGANSWLRPGDLARARLADRIKGVYLPFWSFSMLAQSHWSAYIGEYWWRTETYTTRDSKGNVVTHTRQVRETEWWPLSGKHHRYYSGYLVSGSRGLSQEEADQIKPYQLAALSRYEPYYLAGWMCEEYSVPRDEALEVCRHEFLHRERAHIGHFMPGDTHRDLDVQTTCSHINSDLCLLPAYVLSYRYKNRLFRFLVNGQTGKTTGQKPWSRLRIAAGITIGVLTILLVCLLIALLGR